MDCYRFILVGFDLSGNREPFASRGDGDEPSDSISPNWHVPSGQPEQFPPWIGGGSGWQNTPP